jgi:hypothetical protein
MLGAVDAEDHRYYRVEEHPTTIVVRGLMYSLWVALGTPILCSGLLGADLLRLTGGLLLVGVGLLLGFRRSGLVVDRHTGRLQRWWGVLVPWASREYPRDRLRAVCVVRYWPNRGGGWFYQLQLETSWRTLLLREAIDADDIRRHGRDLAEALGLPLLDESGG